MKLERPDVVVLAAAKVGGILANDAYPADFLGQNISIQSNVIESAFRNDVEKLIFLGSSCIYPKFAPQPIPEHALLTGALEPTNEWYAIAKIAGLKMCQAYRRQYGVDYISAMPTNLYGPGDNFDLKTSHVVPALLRKAHEAVVKRRAGICHLGHRQSAAGISIRRRCGRCHRASSEDIFAVKAMSTWVRGEDVSIMELARQIGFVTDFRGKISTQPDKPDGTPRKLLDVSRLFASGWRPSYDLDRGLRETYRWFRMNVETAT